MYVANFTKESTHDYAGFFNVPTNSKEIIELRKEIRKLQEKLEESVSKMELLKNSIESDMFTPISTPLVLLYSGRAITLLFSLETGLPYEDDTSECDFIKVYNKTGDFYAVVGYSYSLGSAVVKHYKYSIPSSNSKVVIQILQEFVVPLFEGDMCYIHDHEKIYDDYIRNNITEALSNINATEFIQNFYGLNKEVPFSLSQLRKYALSNASFEIILRTAREKDFNCLAGMKNSRAVPIYKMIEVTKEEYQLLIEKDCLEDFISIRSLIKNYSEEIKMSAMDIINFLDNCKRWKENMEFYDIEAENLPRALLESYLGLSWRGWSDFYKYYSIGKFCNYVVSETINQGYTGIDRFVNSLKDYIKMCVGVGLKPHLYTTSLELTHNVAARNYKIALTEEQETIFKNRYADFEPFEFDKYVLLAPRTSEDVKSEGSALNHCVASYIKDILDGDTQIFFLRLKKEYKNSLVTVEIRGKAVVQARGASNRDLVESEEEALRAFCADRKLAYKV